MFKVNQQSVSNGVYTGSIALRHTVQHKTKSKYILTLRAVVRDQRSRKIILDTMVDATGAPGAHPPPISLNTICLCFFVRLRER